MDPWITLILSFLVIIRSSPAEEIKNLTAVVGGSVSLPHPVLELGFIFDKISTIAMLDDRGPKILDEKYNNKLHWNKESGLFTLSDLQKNDSGVYKVESKKPATLVVFSLTVYDPAPTPTVETQNLTSESCFLLCSVDKPATLLWFKGQEVVNQSSSALFLRITVEKIYRDSSYSCVASNPAEHKTVNVNLTSSCGFKETDSEDQHRTYLITGIILGIVLIALVALGGWMTKKKYLNKKETTGQTQGSVKQGEVLYTPIHIKDKRPKQDCEQTSPQTENAPEPPGTNDSMDLTTVYAKLEHPQTDQPC